ncbi:DUF3427 domain-containing protein [Archangium violaceum]|uniref:DUF3427 domain-containing protein n=1 Tax=Archangium violaceum TaxID=83451 RepID=UPI0007C7E45A|nr:DUF3427 domain-containing protein [Archangium violaceum]
MTDFFISYTRVDKAWADWVAWVLEEAGYSVVLDTWDFRPGSNFVLAMEEGLAKCERIIAILTPAYVQSDYGRAEWTAGMASDPTAMQRRVIPVRVAPCEPPALLRSILYIDLVGLGDEETARKRLLESVTNRRAKPEKAPSYPGAAHHRAAPHHPVFPAAASSRATSPAPFVPRLPTKVTDLEIRRFMQESFKGIRAYFEEGLAALERSDARFDTEFLQVHSLKFVAEVYVDGNKLSSAKLWLDSSLGAGLQMGYAEGTGFSLEQDTQFNEVLAVAPDEQGLHLRALMSAAYFGSAMEHLDPERMTSQEAAEYLWRRFVARIAPESGAVSRSTPPRGSRPRVNPGVVADEQLDEDRKPRSGEKPKAAKLKRWQEYLREQIPPFFGLEFSEARWHTGFVPFAEHGQVFLLVTLEKRTMAESFQYADHFISPSLFQWQSQNRTTQQGKHGQLLRNHVAEGVSVHLFVRAEKKLRSGNAAPFIYCGPVRFESWKGEEPITVMWRLDEPVPTRLREVLKVPSEP